MSTLLPPVDAEPPAVNVSVDLTTTENATDLPPSTVPSPPSPPSPPPTVASPPAVRVGGRFALQTYTESLATPLFLHRLGSALFFYHCLLLFTNLSTIALYCLIYTPQQSTMSVLLLFLIFHSIKSFTSLFLLVLRARYPHLWHTQLRSNEPWLATFDSTTRQFYHIQLLCRLCFLAWLVLGTVWYCESEWEGVERPLMLEVVVLAVLVLEYAVVGVQLVVFAHLLCLFPYSQLSFSLPFIPIPLPSLPASFSSRQRGLTDKQIRTLPTSAYQQSQQAGEAVEEMCAVCLSALLDGERVRRLHCRHCFHQPCIDEWLVRRAVCPLCVRTVTAPKQRSAGSDERLIPSVVQLSSLSGLPPTLPEQGGRQHRAVSV